MKSLILLVLLLEILDRSIANIELCNRNLCKPGQEHTGCRNPFKFGKECAPDAIIVGVRQKLIKMIVNQHNEMRNQVAHGFNGFGVAARMGTMTWSDELAQLAELNVRQCVLKRSKCFATKQFKNPGQNLAYNKFQDQQGIDEIMRSQIRMWFEEYQISTPESLLTGKGNEDVDVSHFLQIIRDRADKVGCAILLQRKHEFTYQFLVCKYSVSVPNSKLVYRQGQIAGDGCKTGTNKRYANLCSTNELYNPHIINDKDAEAELDNNDCANALQSCKPEKTTKVSEAVRYKKRYKNKKNKKAISHLDSGIQQVDITGNVKFGVEMYSAEMITEHELNAQIQNVFEMKNLTNLSEPNILVGSFE